MKTIGLKRIGIFTGILSVWTLLFVAPGIVHAQALDGSPGLPLQYPRAQNGIVHVEAESAVSSNFSQQATLDYGSSGQRMLQLNQGADLSDNGVYFAEWIFYVEEAGTYRFWFGGTPPGPEELLNPSYVSPFRYTINGKKPVDVYREKVAVVESYSPILYWVDVAELRLEKGINQFRIEVPQRRRYDNRFYFFVDSLLFVRQGLDLASVQDTGLRLPKNPTNRTINNSYRPFSEYEALIQAKPREISHYLTIASVYSLVGDYQGALRFLLRGLLIDPAHPELNLMVAKNRIWKGELAEGLKYFRIYLSTNPGNPDVWAEAAKIAAWNGEYELANDFYQKGLGVHPDNLTLKINRGLTLLWANKVREGNDIVESTVLGISKDSSALLALADIFVSNGYADKAAGIYESVIENFPQLVEAYLLLSDVQLIQGNTDKAKQVLAELRSLSPGDPALDIFLEAFKARQNARNQVIQSYREKLKENPDNPPLRTALVQALFWNGMKVEGLAEYENKFMNEYFRTILNLFRNEQVLFTDLADVHELSRVLMNLEQALGRWQGELIDLGKGKTESEGLRTRLTKEQELLTRKTQALEPRLIQARNLEESLADGERRNQARTALKELEAQSQKLSRENEELVQKIQESEESISRNTHGFLAFENRLAQVTAMLSQLLQEQTRISMAIQGRLGRFNEQTEQLKTVEGKKGWRFDASVWKSEFKTTLTHGSMLGTANLAFYLATEQKGVEARVLLDTLRTSDGILPVSLEPIDVLVELASRKSVNLTSNGLIVKKGALDVLLGTEEQLQTTVPTVVQNELALKASLLQLTKQIQTVRTDLRTYEITLWKEINQSLAYYTYLFEEDNYPGRIQWGEYARGAGFLEKAVDQFQKAVTIDTSNIRVKTMLAGAQEQLGYWFDARDRYRDIYQADPADIGIMSRHNALERLHGSTSFADIVLGADPGKTTDQFQLGWKSTIFQGFDLSLVWAMERNTIHRPTMPWPDPDQTQAQKLETLFDYQPGAAWPVLSARLGILLENELVENQYSQLPGPFLLPDTLSYQRPHFLGGIGLRGMNGPVTASLGYNFQPVNETLMGLRSLAWSHQLDGQISTYFLPEAKSFYSFFSTRTFGQADLRLVEGRDEPVILGTAVQDIILGFHILDEPWTGMNLVMTGTFEQSSSHEALPFYTPKGVLTAKAGPQVTSSIALGNGDVLGVVGRLAGGVYLQGLGDATALMFPLVEADMDVQLVLGGFAFYVRGIGSATYKTTGVQAGVPEYWSGQIRFGIRNKVEDLLAP